MSSSKWMMGRRVRGDVGSPFVILDRLDAVPADLEQRTGWAIKAEGACREDVCVPLSAAPFDVSDLADRLAMPLVHDEAHGVWALGPSFGGGRSLMSAKLPDIVLPDHNGDEFALRWLRGTKVFMIAWASW
jgi:hypothetical protein